MIIRAIDTETLGLNADDGVCEVGYCDIVDGKIEPPVSRLVNPGKPIPPQASGVHHITDADVVGSLSLEDTVASLHLFDGVDCLAAHVASFENKFIATSLQWICSYKVAMTLAPHAPDHKLQTLRYWSNLAVDQDLASPSHRAGPDAYVCACLVTRMLAKMPVNKMIEVSAAPVFLSKFNFGKYAMVPLAEVPSDYLYWMRDKGSFDDEDVVHTVKTELARRRAENGRPA